MGRRAAIGVALAAAAVAAPLVGSAIGMGQAMSDLGLHDAAAKDDAAAIRALLAAGAAIDARDNAGRTPLLVATQVNGIRAAEALIAAGADVNLADGNGVTPLHHARGRGFAAMEQALAKAGAR